MKFCFLVILVILNLIQTIEGQIENNTTTNQTETNEVKKEFNREKLIHQITRQIRKIAKRAFKNAKSYDDKQKLLEFLKTKLVESARRKQKQLGIDDKTLSSYINIIMKSIDVSARKHQVQTRRLGSDTNNETSTEKAEESETQAPMNLQLNMMGVRDKLIQEITDKVSKISQKAVEKIKSPEDMDNILAELKKQLYSSAERRRKALNLSPDSLNSYVELILKSIEHNLRASVEPSRRAYFPKQEETTTQNTTNAQENQNIDLSHGFSFFQIKKVSESYCDDIEESICKDVKFILKATCSYDEMELPITKICDGSIDCPDASDEKNCSQQILTHIHKTNNILKSLVSHIAHQCLEGKEQSQINEQNKILNDVLNTQVAIIKSHNVLGNTALRLDTDVLKFKHAALTNDVASVILMTTNAINSVLCKEKQEHKKMVVLTRKMSEALDEDFERKINKIALESSKTCACRNLKCERDDCPERCKHVCRNKYYLDRWVCSDEVTSIPMDLVCDGKTDCFDESDEFGCEIRNSMTKVENDRAYDDVIRLIGLKSNSDDFSHVINRMNTLVEKVKKLREVTMGNKAMLHAPTIKIVRNETYDLIKLIYDESLKELVSDDQISKVYDFLRSIASKLLVILKNSHTGNTKIIYKELCWCQDSRCIMPNCSKPCQRACSMERRLLNHTCADYKNVSITLEQLCNGRIDCPLGDDEENCKKDICHRHHLLTLASVLKTMGDDVKSASLSATIQNWRHEAIEKTKKVEKSVAGRPTRPTIRRLMYRILQDLVMSYAAVTVTKRNNFDVVRKEYDKIAQTVRSLYKACER